MSLTGLRNRPLRSPQRPADQAGGRNTPDDQTLRPIAEHPTPNPSAETGEAHCQFRPSSKLPVAHRAYGSYSGRS